ncbi:MAG: hypothetical protein F4X57_13000 [Chloroflexi bacterium]|nr:hypothetical protein [Chloroflexota bacterium]
MTTMQEKTAQLITTLTEKTSQNRIEWEKTPSERIYKVQFNGDAVFIREHEPSQLGNKAYSLSIVDDSGQVVEIIRQQPGDDNYTRLAQMYIVSRRSAEYNAEASLDRLLQELESR